MRFLTFFGDKNPRGNEDYTNVPYIVDSAGYETVPQIMARLLRGELVSPIPVTFDSVSDDDSDLDNLRDVPIIEDITDVVDVADELEDIARRQRVDKQSELQSSSDSGAQSE